MTEESFSISIRGMRYVCLFFKASRAAVSQLPVHWILGVLFVEVKRSGREFEHSPPFGGEIKYAWSYTSTPSYTLMACTGTTSRFPSLYGRCFLWSYIFLFYFVENVFLVCELHCLFASYLLERDIVDTSRLSIVTVFYWRCVCCSSRRKTLQGTLYGSKGCHIVIVAFCVTSCRTSHIWDRYATISGSHET